MLKDLISKNTNISLFPNLTGSVYSQDFSVEVENYLTPLPKFQAFWRQIYTNEIFLAIQDPLMKELCVNINNSMTSFGQKVMFQYMEDYIRRKTAKELFDNSLTNPSVFMKVARLQFYLTRLGQEKILSEIKDYKEKSEKLQLITASIGTALLLISIFLSRMALNDIRAKINDG